MPSRIRKQVGWRDLLPGLTTHVWRRYEPNGDGTRTGHELNQTTWVTWLDRYWFSRTKPLG